MLKLLLQKLGIAEPKKINKI